MRAVCRFGSPLSRSVLFVCVLDPQQFSTQTYEQLPFPYFPPAQYYCPLQTLEHRKRLAHRGPPANLHDLVDAARAETLQELLEFRKNTFLGNDTKDDHKFSEHAEGERLRRQLANAVVDARRIWKAVRDMQARCGRLETECSAGESRPGPPGGKDEFEW